MQPLAPLTVLVAGGLVSMVLAAGCSTAATAPPSADGGAQDAEAPKNPDCAKFCAKAASAACPSSGGCERDCQEQIRQTPSQCRGEVNALIACSAYDGNVTGCDAKGKPKLEGCNVPLGTYLDCLLGGGGAGADAAPAGPRCEDVKTESATCDTCMDRSCCADESACAGSPDCAAYTTCISTGRTTCDADHPIGGKLSRALGACRTSACGAVCP